MKIKLIILCTKNYW